jgi:hypothetical protein
MRNVLLFLIKYIIVIIKKDDNIIIKKIYYYLRTIRKLNNNLKIMSGVFYNAFQ